MNEIGISRRLSRLKTPSGKFALIALDHGLTDGEYSGAATKQKIISHAAVGGLTGVVTNYGESHLLASLGLPLIIQCTGIPRALGGAKLIQTASVEDAIRTGADCVSVQIMGDQCRSDQVQLISKITRSANSFGVPVLLMLGGTESMTCEKLVRSIRSASQLGVNILKTRMPIDANENGGLLRTEFNSLPPIVLSGGPSCVEFRRQLELALGLGFSGVCIGRNIFESTDPGSRIRDVIDYFG